MEFEEKQFFNLLLSVHLHVTARQIEKESDRTKKSDTERVKARIDCACVCVRERGVLRAFDNT